MIILLTHTHKILLRYKNNGTEKKKTDDLFHVFSFLLFLRCVARDLNLLFRFSFLFLFFLAFSDVVVFFNFIVFLLLFQSFIRLTCFLFFLLAFSPYLRCVKRFFFCWFVVFISPTIFFLSCLILMYSISKSSVGSGKGKNKII